MDYEPVRRVSQALFGHRYRLELLAELAEAGEHGICVGDMAADHGASASVFYPPLRQLELVGLVSRRRDPESGRRVFYSATRHRVWTAMRALVHAASNPEVPTGSRDG